MLLSKLISGFFFLIIISTYLNLYTTILVQNLSDMFMIVIIILNLIIGCHIEYCLRVWKDQQIFTLFGLICEYVFFLGGGNGNRIALFA